MRAVVQRVSQASVKVDGQTVGSVDQGLLVLLGVQEGDGEQDAKYLADKIRGLRVFEDDQGRMNLSVADIGGSLLVVSQFTLLGDVRRGKRPSFTSAAEPDIADQWYQFVCRQLAAAGLRVEQGVFRADMKVSLINDGPVTILLDSRKLF